MLDFIITAVAAVLPVVVGVVFCVVVVKTFRRHGSVGCMSVTFGVTIVPTARAFALACSPRRVKFRVTLVCC